MLERAERERERERERPREEVSKENFKWQKIVL